MRRSRDTRMIMRGAVSALAIVITLALAGCGVLAKELSDGDFDETIPAALAASDIGITDSFASKGLDGFTFNLVVGVDLDDQELSPDDLAGILRIVLENNDVPSDQIQLSVTGSDGESIDVPEVVTQISPDLATRASLYGSLSVTNEQAIAIVKAVWGD